MTFIDPPTRRELDTKQGALLRLLSDGRAHSQQEVLDAGGYRYTGRMKELRDAGHDIRTIRVADSGRKVVYQLVAPKTATAARQMGLFTR